MIRKPQNWETVQEIATQAKLPVGAYVCKTKQVSVQNYGSGSQLAILFDISEGEYKDFFARQYQGNTNADKKWKGVLRVWLAKDDGSERDEMTKRMFKGMVTAFENSNPGYKWNWDESTLTHKEIGILFRNEEWEYNGKHGWAVKPLLAMSASKVRSGDFDIPADKPLEESSYMQQERTGMQMENQMTVVETDDLPF